MPPTSSAPFSASELDAHRTALNGHCYRMMGSAADAEDAAQETLVRAWSHRERFDGRSSLRTWLYRIATNVCLDQLAQSKRRARPMEEGPVGTVDDPLHAEPRTHWLEPVPDAWALPAHADPSELAVLRQSIRLAFVSALQHLPPRQRAVLILAEVLGWSAAEIAEGLAMSVAAVNSALQRARATLEARRAQEVRPAALDAKHSQLLERYMQAFLAYDLDALMGLLHQDAVLSMPPFSLWLQGREAIRAWLTGRGCGCEGSRLVPTAACGSPAFGQYRADPEGGHKPFALIVLETDGERIAGWNSFLDTETLFPLFGLPLHLPAGSAVPARIPA
jgi:RNA polymerase sigma-70 factor (ECF subfamily)